MAQRGRPPKFKNVEELIEKFDDYSSICDKNGVLPEKAGLCLFLGISRDTYSEYRKKPDYSDTIKGIDLYIESNWVRRLASSSPTGAIFYLKNAFKEEYRDRNETDITTNGKTLPTPILNLNEIRSDNNTKENSETIKED